MSYSKTGILLLVTVLLFSTATAQLQFKTDNPIDYFSSIDMNNNQISNLSNPVNGGDAIPLDYIQDQFLERDGDTLDGNLNMNNYNITGLNYLNGQNTSKLGEDGYLGDNKTHTAGGNLDMDENAITNIDWSSSDKPPISLAFLSTGNGLSGTDYNGSSSSTWSVNWGDAYDLNNNGGITDFSNANDLDNNGNLNPTNNLNMNDNNIRDVGTITSEGGVIQESTPRHGGLSSGWYTIAENNGDRASAKFIVKDTQSGKHSATHFYASHHYSNANAINVLSTSDYGSGCVERLRIKAAGTYDGAILQAYLDEDSCSGVEAFMMENFQDSGWTLKDWVSGDTIEGLSTVTKWNLDSGVDNAVRFSEGIQTKGNLDMNNNQVENVGTPNQSSDAATKGYVDSNSGGELVFTGTHTSSSSRKCTTEYDGSVSVSTTASCSDPDAFIAGYRKYSLSHTTEDSTSGYCSRDHLSSSYPNGYTNWDTKKSQSSVSTSSSADHYEYGGSVVQAQVRIVCAKYN